MKVIGDRLSPTIYGFAENGWLYRTNNDGRTWAMITTAPQVDDFIMNAGNPDVLYSGAGIDCSAVGPTMAPLVRSEDGGLTWTALPNGMNLRPLLTNPADPDMVFAADCAMLYFSVDGGRTWTAKPDNAVVRLWDRYTVVDMSAAALVGDPQPETPVWDQLFALGVDAADLGAVAFTGELGDSWVDITEAAQPPRAPAVIRAHLTNAGSLWVVAADGVWATPNFGVNWGFTNEGLPRNLRNGGLNDLTYGVDGVLYLATDIGLFRQYPGENTWNFVANKSVARRSMVSLLLTESSPGQLWVNTDDGVFKLFVSM